MRSLITKQQTKQEPKLVTKCSRNNRKKTKHWKIFKNMMTTFTICIWNIYQHGWYDPLYNIGVKAKLAESSVSLAMGKSRIRLMFCQCQWWEVQKTPGNFTRYFWREGGRLLPSLSWNLLQSEEKNEQENKIDTRARLGLSEEETESLNAALHIWIFSMKISKIYLIWKLND